MGCGRANASRPGSAANATAYVTPNADGTPATYLVRVAEFADNSASSGLPTVLVRFAARDVTAPHIRVKFEGTVAPGASTTYDASDTDDAASQVNPASARWEFHDKVNGRDVVRTREGSLRESYRWVASGAHDVVFRVADFAGNESMYRFTTVVLDTVRPDVKFSLRPPEPGDRRLRITIQASESVRVRLLVTQVGRAKPLMRRVVSFWGDRLAGAFGAAARRRAQGHARDHRLCARSLRQHLGTAAVRRRSRDRPGALHLTVTPPSRSATDP